MIFLKYKSVTQTERPAFSLIPFEGKSAVVSPTSLRWKALTFALCAFALPHSMHAATIGKTSHPLLDPLGSGTAPSNATLTLQPIPEPQTWLTALSGLGTLLAMQRFRRTRS